MGNNMARFGTYNQALPPEGPKAYPFNVDFRQVTQQEIDLTNEKVRGFISFVQALFVDNRLNPGPVKIKATGIFQEIQIPAHAQAYMPMLVTDEIKLEVAVDAVGTDLIVPIICLNVPVMPYIWQG